MKKIIKYFALSSILLVVIGLFNSNKAYAQLNLAKKFNEILYGIVVLPYGTVGYGQFNFLNDTYFRNKSEGTIKSKGGWDVNLYELELWKFALDIGFFWTWFDVSDEEFIAEYKAEYNRMRGWDVYVSFLPLRNWSKFTNVVSPYIGIGYQTAVLQAMYDTTEYSRNRKDTRCVDAGNLDVSGVLWKSGIQFNFYNTSGIRLTIKFEYKQSLDLNSPTAVNQFSIGGGVGFFGLKKTRRYQ